ncbi:hypothetical protein AV530_015615 [Patagioenas fasciata monilis]|uniref:Uncharacterized protein n=1 Tax=Patagioenas fasciata monilis TaxID=372326 RepID=A0A1V4KI85_PATFA|nr:hypothetical protein AV530_015615 [Patagioenas fasciata monilis]
MILGRALDCGLEEQDSYCPFLPHASETRAEFQAGGENCGVVDPSPCRTSALGRAIPWTMATSRLVPRLGCLELDKKSEDELSRIYKW